jgi:hypothetical protein
VNDNPTAAALSNSSIVENAGANAVVGTLSTTDPDAGDTFTYTLVSGTGSTDNALRTHLYPTTLADAVNRSVVVTFTDQGSIAYAITGHIVSASRSDDGTQAGMWNVSVEEA